MKTLLLLLFAIAIPTPAYCQTAGSAEDRVQIDAQLERIRAMGRAGREPSEQPPELDVHDPSGSYFKNAEYQKDQLLKCLQEIIENNKKVMTRSPAHALEGKKSNAENEKMIEALETSPVFEPLILVKLGSVGVLRMSTELRQRIGDGTALVEVNAFTNNWDLNSWTPERVFSKELMIMRGMDFSAFVDGKSFTTDQVFQITGTTTYNTALGGTKTVYVIQPIDDATKRRIEERYSEIEKERSFRLLCG